MGAKLGQVKKLEPVKATGYRASALNAVRHGVLSRHVILPHEDRAEFEELLAGLHDEHKPRGATERHLVDDLAGILWRKRRVLMAEGAKLSEAMRGRFNSEDNLGDAVPTDLRLHGARFAKRELFTLTPATRADYLADIREDIEHTEAAEKVLEEGGPDAYRRALEELREDSRGWWQSELEGYDYAPSDYEQSADSLTAFIADKLRPEVEGQLAAVEHQPDVITHLQGEAAGRMIGNSENLQRYETHLDRKLERTLAMLLRLRELRPANQK